MGGRADVPDICAITPENHYDEEVFNGARFVHNTNAIYNGKPYYVIEAKPVPDYMYYVDRYDECGNNHAWLDGPNLGSTSLVYAYSCCGSTVHANDCSPETYSGANWNEGMVVDKALCDNTDYNCNGAGFLSHQLWFNALPLLMILNFIVIIIYLSGKCMEIFKAKKRRNSKKYSMVNEVDYDTEEIVKINE